MKSVVIKCTRCKQDHVYNIDTDNINFTIPFNFACPNIKRLPRVSSFRIDFTKNLPTEYDKEKDIITDLYGADKIEEKIKRRNQINKPKMWLIYDFDQYFEEIADAYILGAFYPVATSCTTLAERVVNLFIMKMRDLYDKNILDSKMQKYIYTKDQNWQTFDSNMKVLKAWKLLSENQKRWFKDLLDIRNKAVHFQASFNPQYDSLKAIKTLHKIIDSYFSALQRKDVLRVLEIPGEIWVKEDMLTDPFVKAFILPCCSNFASCGLISSINGKNIYHEDDAVIGLFSEADFIAQRLKYQESDKVATEYRPAYEKITFSGRELIYRVI